MTPRCLRRPKIHTRRAAKPEVRPLLTSFEIPGLMAGDFSSCPGIIGIVEFIMVQPQYFVVFYEKFLNKKHLQYL